MATDSGETRALLYQQDFPPPERCSEHSIEGRCINVGKFVLVTGAGNVTKFSCRGHLAQMVVDLRSVYQSPVSVDLSGRNGVPNADV